METERERYTASRGIIPSMLQSDKNCIFLRWPVCRRCRSPGRWELAARARRARGMCSCPTCLRRGYALGPIRTSEWICAITDFDVADGSSTKRVPRTLAARMRIDGRYAGIDAAANVRSDRFSEDVAVAQRPEGTEVWQRSLSVNDSREMARKGFVSHLMPRFYQHHPLSVARRVLINHPRQLHGHPLPRPHLPQTRLDHGQARAEMDAPPRLVQ